MSDCQHELHESEWKRYPKEYYRQDPKNSEVLQFKSMAEYFCICGKCVKKETIRDWHNP